MANCINAITTDSTDQEIILNFLQDNFAKGKECQDVVKPKYKFKTDTLLLGSDVKVKNKVDKNSETQTVTREKEEKTKENVRLIKNIPGNISPSVSDNAKASESKLESSKLCELSQDSSNDVQIIYQSPSVFNATASTFTPVNALTPHRPLFISLKKSNNSNRSKDKANFEKRRKVCSTKVTNVAKTEKIQFPVLSLPNLSTNSQVAAAKDTMNDVQIVYQNPSVLYPKINPFIPVNWLIPQQRIVYLQQS